MKQETIFVPEDFLNAFAKRLALLRRDRNMNQTELAAALTTEGNPITPSYISKLERVSQPGEGKPPSYPGVQLLIALADLLDTTTDYLLLRDDNPLPRKQEAEDNKLSFAPVDEEERQQAYRLLEAYNQLTAYEREMLIKMAGELLKLRKQAKS